MNILKHIGVSARFLLVVTLLLGIIYPFSIYLGGQLFAKHQASGSIVESQGRPIGSILIGQDFSGPQWFHSRPSNAGAHGYDALASGASNAGPNDQNLRSKIETLKTQIAKEEGVSIKQVPADAVTASGSGLDPDISLSYALIQVARVSRERGISVSTLRIKIEFAAHHPLFGFLGEDTVNVLQLNLSLKG